MKNKFKYISILLGALIITLLFHQQYLGFNLFIFEIIFFLWLLFTKQLSLKGTNQKIVNIGYLLSSIFVVITNSGFSIVMNFISLIVLMGFLIYPEVKSMVNAVRLSVLSIFASQAALVKSLSGAHLPVQKMRSWGWRSRIFILPIGIIVLFILIYSLSNPTFSNLTIQITNFINRSLNYLFKHIDFSIILTFLIGLLISIYLIFMTSNKRLESIDLRSNDVLTRIKNTRKRIFNLIALKNEYRAAVFLLFTLNMLILILNIIDIESVWINFKWEGQYLKQFVHIGTYLLILSIVISMALVLYFFRGNLHFYSKNKWLKYLSYIWLAQNGVLVISVAIRNFWYIHYFSLAYKRIGVIIFLALTICGLISILIKVYKNKSTFYLLRTNAMAWYMVLMSCSFVNWDTIIVQYNFNNYQQSLVHLDYLSILPDHTLPYLDKSMEELAEIDTVQDQKFTFRRKFMSAEDYKKIVEQRKINFKNRWESQGILSWNWPEYHAYQQLFQKP